MNLKVGDIVQYVDKFSDAYMLCSEFEPQCTILVGEVIERAGRLVIQQLEWNRRGGRYISYLDGDASIDLTTINVIGQRNNSKIR